MPAPLHLVHSSRPPVSPPPRPLTPGRAVPDTTRAGRRTAPARRAAAAALRERLLRCYG